MSAFDTALGILGNWFSGIWENLIRKKQNIPVVLVALLVSYYLAIEIFKLSGWITFTGYIFAIVYGLAKIIDDPNRVVYWALGYIIGQQAIKIAVQMIPSFKSSTDFITSAISVLVILYVCIALYLKAKELKDK